MNDKTLGQIAFEAYSKALDHKDVRGGPIPPWDQLKDEVKVGWQIATSAVIEHMLLNSVRKGKVNG